MRHRKKRTLNRGRDINRRRMRQLATSLILHERIETTSAQAKILRSEVEKMITRGKVEGLHPKRALFSKLPPNAARKVYEVLSPKYKERAGGYTRLIRVPAGKDGNPKVIIEFV